MIRCLNQTMNPGMPMSAAAYNPTSDYQPQSTLGLPALYRWPFQPLAALHYLFVGMLLPWGYLYVALGFIAWYFLTPAMATMTEFAPGWIALVWLRNAALLTLVAGGLHWWLYLRRSQDDQYKFHRRWPDTDNDKFLWRNQVWDNVFWSLASGVTIWTGFEVITLWIYANGYVAFPSIAEHPIYFASCILGVFFWGTVHFYCIHRFSHWPPLYRVAHELHHRNVNTGPWTGISMHPLEHLLYFNGFMLFWFLPVHPVVILVFGMFMGIGPAPSHCGFNFVTAGRRRIPAGDWYHQLHHQYFDLNYGNTTAPLDKLFGSWHDGSKESLMAQKARGKARRRSQSRGIPGSHS